VSLLAREVEIFLTETGQGAAWADWLKLQPKYEGNKSNGLQLLIAQLDPTFLANLYPQFPHDDAHTLRQYCAQHASQEDLELLFSIGQKAEDFWLNYKASPEVRSLVQKAMRETSAISDERRGNTAKEKIFSFITGGLRYFIEPQQSARPLLSKMDLLAYLDESAPYYADLIAADKLAEIKLLDRKIGQTEYFARNESNKSLRLYKNEVMLQIARSNPHYVETIYPQIPYRQLPEFKAFCLRADVSGLKVLFQIATEKDGFWINHKASAEIRAFLNASVTQAGEIFYERNHKGEPADIFAFVVGGLRLFSHERPYFRESISFADYLAFLTEHTEYFADRWAKSNQAELKFLDSAIGNTSFFESHGQAAPYIQYLRHVQLCISREDPSFIERIYPEFPHQNLADFKNYVREKAGFEDLMKLYGVVTEVESFWLNFKAHADIRACLDESLRLTDAIYSERKEVIASEKANIFAFVVGGVRFYSSVSNTRIYYKASGPGVDLHSKADLIHYLFENKDYFQSRNEDSEHAELEFLDREIGNLHFFNQKIPLHQNSAKFRFENYYNALIDRPIDLAEQVMPEVLDENGQRIPGDVTLDGQTFTINLGKLRFRNYEGLPCQIFIRLLPDKPGLPLINSGHANSRAMSQAIRLKPYAAFEPKSFQLHDQNFEVSIQWASVTLALRQTRFHIGYVQSPSDWDRIFKFSVPVDYQNVDLHYAHVTSTGAFSGIATNKVVDGQLDCELSLNKSSDTSRGNPKAVISLSAVLTCDGFEFPLDLILTKDYPILQVIEKSEGNYHIETDNGIEVTFDIEIDDKRETVTSAKHELSIPRNRMHNLKILQGSDILFEDSGIYKPTLQITEKSEGIYVCETDNGIKATFDLFIDNKKQTVTSAKHELRIPRNRIHELKIKQDSVVIFEKTAIFREHFANRKARRFIGVLMIIACLVCAVLAFRTEAAFRYAFQSENALVTKFVSLVNVGNNAEYLTEIFRSGSNNDKKRAVQFARKEGTYSPELFSEFSNFLPNKDAEPAEILSLFAARSRAGSVINIPAVGVAYKGSIWQNCTFGTQGAGCEGAPNFATWPIAAAKCHQSRTRGVEWALPTTAQLDEISEDTEKVFDFHRLNPGDQIYWSSDRLQNEGKAKVVDFSKNTVFRAFLQNEYVFRCVGIIMEPD
jgi:hypothetical protein